MKLGMVFLFWGVAAAQEGAHQHPAAPPPVALQPLAQQVRQLEEALNYLGQPLPAASRKRINDAIGDADRPRRWHRLEATLDPYVLVTVDINAESRVKVEQGAAKPELVEAGTRLFLVKVINNGHVTAPLAVESPNSGAVYIRSNGNPEPPMQLTPRESAERWADISLYQQPAHAAGVFPAWRWNTRFSKSTAATPASVRPRSASTWARGARTSASATTSRFCSPRCLRA